MRCMLGAYGPDRDREASWVIDDATMSTLQSKWAWRTPLDPTEDWSVQDGSRSGEIGLVLADEVARDRMADERE